MTRIIASPNAHAPLATVAPVVARLSPRPAWPQRRPSPSAPNPLLAPRPRTVCAAGARSSDDGMSHPADALHLNMLLGGARGDNALAGCSLQTLAGAAARMRQSAEPVARRAFVRAVLQRDAADGLAVLQDFAKDADENVRHALVQDSPLWRPAAARALLRELAHDPAETAWVRQTAVRTLALHGDAESLQALRRDPSNWVRLAVVEGLAKIAPQTLTHFLRDADAWVRAAALHALPHHPSSDQARAIGEVAVKDSVAWVRHMALRTLALHDLAVARVILRQMPPGEQWPLSAMLTRLEPRIPQRWAGDVLRKMDDMSGWRYSAAAPELHRDRAADPHVSDQTRHAAADAAMEQAVRMLKDTHLPKDHVNVRHAAALLAQGPSDAAISNMLSGSAPHHLAVIVPVLERLRTSSDVIVRRLLPEKLRKLPKEPATLPMLAAMADDPDVLVRKAVATELFQISHAMEDHAPCVPILQQLLQDPDASVRATAAGAVAGLNAPASTGLLIMAARDCDASVRSAALWPLCHRSSPEAAAALRLLAQDPDPQIRQSVARTVQHMPMDLSFPLLSMLASDKHPLVRRALVYSLQDHARGFDKAPRAAEVALLALDNLDHADAETSKILHRVRSSVLADALVAFQDSRDMLQMLHTWVPALHSVDTQGMERLASCAYPQRGALLAQLLESPHAAVREAVRGAVTRKLESTARR